MKRSVWRLIPGYAWIAFSFLLVWASISQPVNIWAKSNKVKARPAISVGVVNYAHISRLELREAEGQASAIFAEAGVEIKWTEYPQKQPSDRPKTQSPCCEFFIRILPSSMAIQRDSLSSALGESVTASTSEASTPGGVASVFFDRADDVSWSQGPFPGQVLGNGMAHEIGHLLIGAGHSPQGIMKGLWTARDLQLASRGQLQFSRQQATLLQRAAQALQRRRPVRLALER